MKFKVGQRVKISDSGETAFRIVLKVDEDDPNQPIKVDQMDGVLADYDGWPSIETIKICNDARDPNRLP